MILFKFSSRLINHQPTNKPNFDVLLAVHLNIFISLFNQLDAQNLFHNKFYFMPLKVLFHASTCFEHICSKHLEA